MTSDTTHIARIDNQFVYNARYQLSARESKVILFLVSKIDPIRQKNLIEQTVSVRELEKVLKGDAKKWGGLYEELELLRDRLVRKGIYLPTEVEINGRMLSGYINWFQHIMPMKDEDGNAAIQFLFSQSLQPFLLNLREYVSINFLEVIPLKSTFSIRMYQVFRAHRDRMAKYQNKSTLQYDLDDFKGLLGVDGKYKDYRNLRKKVLEVIVKEINEHTSIEVKINGITECYPKELRQQNFSNYLKKEKRNNGQKRKPIGEGSDHFYNGYFVCILLLTLNLIKKWKLSTLKIKIFGPLIIMEKLGILLLMLLVRLRIQVIQVPIGEN